MKKYAISGLLVLSLVAGGASLAGDEFEAAWQAADDKRKEAAGMQSEWRDTKKMLDKAKQAAEKGDIDTAMSLVAMAHEQAADGIVQAEREAVMWITRVPR
ncbi:MAG: SoxXA-binding protein [Gammaproteobacteria bacterium]|nr:SoxXA-binding protein [Gammaproteobacteria bacterium]MCY4226494.1 SoxXA-binding protein [Gammaproteobacteria bacterium]MCY4312847.1 SoxXA-binding protein [Gammaproteobacteria bacterium]